MDTTINYQAKAKALLNYLSEHGYSANYVNLFKNECNRAVGYLSVYGTFDGYLEGYNERFGLELYSPRLGAVRRIRSYFENGRLPSHQHPLRQTNTCYENLSATFRSHLDLFVSSCGTDWSTGTVRTMRSGLSSFLLHLQQFGNNLADVTEKDIWLYFYDSASGTVLHSVSSSVRIRSFLRWASCQLGCEYYARILQMVPVMKQPHKVFDGLTDEDDAHLMSYVLGDGCGLSLRDVAIVTVARFCGLRACDIAALRMSDIDLKRCRLRIRQRKTGVPLEQVLRPVVGNAICRYVMQERPMSDLQELFLIDDKDVRPLTPNAISSTCDRAYQLAGVRKDYQRGGSHLLRHRFAQTLVEGGACDSVTMRLLGHTSPESINVYLETDYRKLQDCALCISCFRIGKEALV